MSLIYYYTFFLKWAGFLSAITCLLGTVMLGISSKIIPWGLRLPKKLRHPFSPTPAVINAANQLTTSRQEWWGYHLKNGGWVLLVIGLFIPLLAGWP